MPLNNSTTQKTRQKYHEKHTFSDSVPQEEADDFRIEEGLTREAFAKRRVVKEDELIWAWSRDPETDVTQIEARDRAQSVDYGRYNISQSSLSRKLSKMDETMLHEEVLRLDGWQFLLSAEWDATEYYDDKLNDNPEYLDAMRDLLAKFICDQHALKEFDNGGEQTPQWAQDRFPDMDPNLGRKSAKRWSARTGEDVEMLCGELHEPHK